ncbi:MAG: sigma-70 family RNA polymerase sigma factor [Actinobacteria bacterium]|nr:sigma-70 family RNA polymerase sigma factor [Actinomycetota bacterium]
MPEFLDILLHCQNGDLTAFRHLVEMHQSFAYSLALRMLCDTEDARDVVQESFIKVWQNIDQFDPNRKFTTWLYKIITNLCLDFLKARRRKSRIFSFSLNSDDGNFADSGIDEEKNCINKQVIRHIKIFAEGLTPKQRIVFVLRDLQDLEMDQVVDITGLNKNNIKSNLYHARMNINPDQIEKILINDKRLRRLIREL